MTSLFRSGLRAIWVAVGVGLLTPGLSPAGTLSGSYALVLGGSAVNLTAAGAVDWVHWGMNTEFGYDRKAAVPALIGTLIPIIAFPGGSGPYQYSDNYNGYSWWDGAPNTFATNSTTGLYAISKGSGFQLTVPADTVLRRLQIYVGAFGAVGQLDATLSDNSATAFSDSSLDNESNGPCAVYTLDYAANSPGQTLTVSFVVKREHDNKVGNVTWQAAALSYTLANNPPSATLTSPAQNASFSRPANIPLAALASDSDGTISKVEFFQGNTKLGQSTGGEYSMVWTNPPPGDYLLRAVATDNGGLTYTSSPVEIFVSTNRGSLTGSAATIPGSADLTADGNMDWAHWGYGSSSAFDHKSGVAQQISNFNPLGSNPAQQISGYPTSFGWSDGTPTLTAGTDTGVSVAGLTNGFELTIPAASYLKTLKLYLGTYAAQGNLQAFLSDFSAPAFSDTSLQSFYGNDYRLYTINFSTPTPGQTLHVRFTSQGLYDAQFGNVVLVAASLSGNAPPQPLPITLLSPSWSNGVFRFSFATETNRTYTAEYTTSLNPASWHVLTNVAGNGSVALVTDKFASSGRRFYRVTIYAVVPPQQIILSNPSWHNGVFSFSFDSEANRTYAVQYTETISTPGWQLLMNLPGSGTTIVVTDTQANSKQRFYQVTTQ